MNGTKPPMKRSALSRSQDVLDPIRKLDSTPVQQYIITQIPPPKTLSSKLNYQNIDGTIEQSQESDTEHDVKPISNPVKQGKSMTGFFRGGSTATSTATSNSAAHFHSRVNSSISNYHMNHTSISSIDAHMNEFLGQGNLTASNKQQVQKKMFGVSYYSPHHQQNQVSQLNISPTRIIGNNNSKFNTKLNNLLLQTTNCSATSFSYISSPVKQVKQSPQRKWLSTEKDPKHGSSYSQHFFDHNPQGSQINLPSAGKGINTRNVTDKSFGGVLEKKTSTHLKGFGSLDVRIPKVQFNSIGQSGNVMFKSRAISQRTIPSINNLDGPQSGINFEDISETFKESMSLLDRSEMKKLQIHEMVSQVSTPTDFNPDQKKNDTLFKPNIATLEQKLVEGRANYIELGMNDFTYFCVRVRGQQSPLRMRINQDKPLNFKVLVSREYSMPSQLNCDFKLSGNVFTFESESNPPDQFSTQEFFYFAIYSNEEAIIRVHVSFGSYLESSNYQTVARVNKRSSGDLSTTVEGNTNNTTFLVKSRNHSDLRIKVHDLTNNQLRQEVMYIMEKRRQRMGGGGVGPNMIQKNIESIKSQTLLEATRSKIELKEMKRAKIQQVQEQKEILIESHIEMISRQKEDRELKKHVKIVMKMNEIKQFQKKSFDFIWITNIILTIATQKLASKLQKHKERQRTMRDMAFSLLRPFFKYKTRARKIGGVNIHARALLDSKFVLQDYVKIKKKKILPEAEQTIIEILKANQARFEAIDKVLRYVKYGKRIVKHLVSFHTKVINYKKLLFRLWDKYYGEIITQIIEVKIDVISLKDPSLAKRYTQNVLLSFNHLDYKRHAIDMFYKNMLDKYMKKLSNTGVLGEEQKIVERQSQEDSTNSIMITEKTFQTPLQSPRNLQDSSNENQPEKEMILQTKKIENKKQIYPRFFVLPTQQDLKQIILSAAIAIYKNYPDLQKKVTFKVAQL